MDSYFFMLVKFGLLLVMGLVLLTLSDYFNSCNNSFIVCISDSALSTISH